MPGTNDFKAIATGVGANVISQSAYAALTSFLANGYSSGVVDSDQFNKVIRQSSFVAAAIGQIVANANINAEDDGDIAGFVSDIITAIAATLPVASTTARGAVELATDAEAQAGTDTERAVTPASLASRTATTTRTGVVELATSAEMATGSSTSLVPPVSAVMSLFSKRSFSTDDYIRIPDVSGGLIIQWGNISSSSAVSFPIAFPTAVAMAFGHLQANSAGPHGANQWYVTTTLSQITMPGYIVASKYIAIGY